jgi:hypothetical protein
MRITRVRSATAGVAVSALSFVACSSGDSSSNTATETTTADTEAPETTAAPTTEATTTTTTTTTTVAPPATVAGEQVPDGPLIDPSTFGDERPASSVGGGLFDLLTDVEVGGGGSVSIGGVAPNVANCVIETLAMRITDDELLALLLELNERGAEEPAAVEVVYQAALDCGITQDQIDLVVRSLRYGNNPTWS